MKRKERHLQAATATAAPETLVPEAEDVVTAAEPAETAKPEPVTPDAEIELTRPLPFSRSEIWKKRAKTMRRTVRFGQSTFKNVKRAANLVKRASSLVDRVTGLPPKIKALTGFDVMGLFTK